MSRGVIVELLHPAPARRAGGLPYCGCVVIVFGNITVVTARMLAKVAHVQNITDKIDVCRRTSIHAIVITYGDTGHL